MQFSRRIVSALTRKSLNGTLLASLVLIGCGGGAETATGVTSTVAALSSSSSDTTASTSTSTSNSSSGTTTTPVVTAPAVVTTTGSSSAVNVALSANRVTGVAPLAVFFDATGTTSSATSMPFHEIKYSWVFGDPAGNVGWSYGSRVGQSSKNEAYGAVAAHVFETPGTYTVTVSAFDGTNTNSKTTIITVTDPNVVFAGQNTICVASGSTPTAGAGGCPIGAAVLSMPKWSTISTLRTTYKRILLRRGDVWSVDGMASFTGTGSAGPGIVGAYGTGSVPKVLLDVDVQAIYMDGASDWRLMDIEFASSTAVGNNKVPVTAYHSNNLTMLRLHMHDVESGFVGGQADGMTIVDSNIHNTFKILGGIGAYIELVDRLAILGTRVSQIPGNHCVRVQGSAGAVISNNQIDTPRWNFPSAGQGGHVLAVRGKAPLNTADYSTWTGTWAENIIVSDNVLDGTAGSIDAFFIGPQNTVSAERLRNVIAERNIVKSVANSVYAEVSNGLTFRNNLVLTTGSPYSMVVASENTVGSPSPSRTFIYNNTFFKPDASSYNGYSAIFMYYSGNGGAPSGTIMKNNLAYAPSDTRDGNSNGSGATFLAANGVPSGNYVMTSNSSDSQVHYSSPGINPPAQWAPGTSSYAYHAGSNVPVWDDFSLKPQTSLWPIGAISP